MATSPLYYANVIDGVGYLSTANTNRDGSGTIVDIVTGGASRTTIERVEIKAVGNTSAGMVRLYLYTAATYRLIYETAVTLVVVDKSTPSFSVSVPININLASAEKLGASTEKGEPFVVAAFGGDY